MNLRHHLLIIGSFSFLMILNHVSNAQTVLTRLDFSGKTLEENQVTAYGAGFFQYPMAEISFGNIPTDNAFKGSTDGHGMIINADPGEGVMIFTPKIHTSNCALLRCSVRTTTANASIYLASIDEGEDQFVSTITPNNPASFVGQYNRIADFFLPPSTGFQGVLQIINTSETEPLVVYADNFEVLESQSDKIEFDLSEIVKPKIEPTPTPTPIPSQPENEITVPLPNLPSGATELEMVYIEPGTFMMGSPSDERGRASNEGPVHQVTLTKGFYMGKYEVTQAQYKAAIGNNPSRNDGDNKPIETVSWYDAARFCNRLSEMKGFTPVYTESGDWEADMSADGFRLPTEAEWEYACRAGTTTSFYFGDALECAYVGEKYCETMDKYMWWLGNNTYQGNPSGTKEVGLKQPNDWGLYDMHGNVYEWCEDWHGGYEEGYQVDPKGPETGSYRVSRGGGRLGGAQYCRSAIRYPVSPSSTKGGIGFRICKNIFNQTVLEHTPTYTIIPTVALTSTPTPTKTSPLTSTPIMTNSPNPSEREITIKLPNLPSGATQLEMVYIEPGTFMMGSPHDERNGDEGPVHQVTLTNGIYMGKYEVTQAQYEAVANNNPSSFDGKNNPVEKVSWYDAARFCNRLSEMKGFTPVYTESGDWEANLSADGFRLPTEAEWEYACRAGTQTRFSHGDVLECDDGCDSCEIHNQYMWYCGNNSPYGTKEVGKKLPNPWGLYDMHGNVCEWCTDWYESDYYSQSPEVDPANIQSNLSRVLRGSGWSSGARRCRSAHRSRSLPVNSFNFLGFRVARTP